MLRIRTITEGLIHINGGYDCVCVDGSVGVVDVGGCRFVIKEQAQEREDGREAQPLLKFHNATLTMKIK